MTLPEPPLALHFVAAAQITAVETIVIECCASVKERCVNSQLRGKTSAFDSRGRMMLTHSQVRPGLHCAECRNTLGDRILSQRPMRISM